MWLNCYIHIPFCTSKCKYCHFASFSSFQNSQIEKYVDFLCGEILAYWWQNIILDTIYFGGWTPWILNPKHFQEIFKTLKNSFVFADDIEITVETNPENITLLNLKFWEKIWINRISIWVQTLNEKSLNEIWRKAKWDIFSALEIINDFSHFKILVSLDFIVWLPYVKKWEVKKDIEVLLNKFDFINHISVYMLEDEKYPSYWKWLWTSEDNYLEEYLEIKRFLETKWFKRYELSNFAKNWNECKHNKWYWEHKNYIWFWVSAHSFLDNIRFSNGNKLEEYYLWIWKVFEKLSDEDLFLERIMFDLRTTWINLADLEKLNREKINFFVDNWYLSLQEEKLTLNDKWVWVLDYILWEVIY
jgi:oxygen-independent coproporphyrinogen-3 oxidase